MYLKLSVFKVLSLTAVNFGRNIYTIGQDLFEILNMKTATKKFVTNTLSRISLLSSP